MVGWVGARYRQLYGWNRRGITPFVWRMDHSPTHVRRVGRRLRIQCPALAPSVERAVVQGIRPLDFSTVVNTIRRMVTWCHRVDFVDRCRHTFARPSVGDLGIGLVLVVVRADRGQTTPFAALDRSATS